MVAILASVGCCIHTIVSPSPRRQTTAGISIVVASFAFGASYSSLFATEILKAGGNYKLSGHIVDVLYADTSSCRLVVSADTLTIGSKQYFNRQGIVKADIDATGLSIGDNVRANGKIYTRYTESFSFDYTAYLENHHFEFDAWAYSITATGGSTSSLKATLAQVRHSLVGRLEQSGVSASNIRLLQALFLGDKSQLSPDIKQAFSDCGIAHLLAVSGLHVGIIYGILTFIFFTICHIKRKVVGYVFVVVALWFYAMLAGMSPSVTRATIMMSTMALSACFYRRYNVYGSMALALLIILLIDPTSLFSVGLWLSFSAVAGIVTFYPMVKRIFWPKNPILNILSDIIIVSFVAQASTLPITLVVFHTFPNYFLPNNIVISAIATPLMGSTLLTIVLSFVPYLGLAAGYVTDGLITCLRSYVQTASAWPYAVVEDIPFGGAESALLIVMLICLGYALAVGELKYWKRFFAAATIFCLVSLGIELINANCARLATFSSQGDQNIVVSNGNKATFYVADPSSSAVYNSISSICTEWRIQEYEVEELRKGMAFAMGNNRMIVGTTRPQGYAPDSVHNDMCVLIGDEMPLNDNTFDRYVIQSQHTWYNEWNHLPSDCSVEHDMQGWICYLPTNVANGIIISSIDMPPCWNVPSYISAYLLKLLGYTK